MQRNNWPVEEHGIRPAGPSDRCFYCNEPRGGVHKPECVIRERTVVVRMTVEYVVLIPEHWTAENLEQHRNQGRWCANNGLEELENTSDRVGCLCGRTKFEFVREATEEDELLDRITVSTVPS